MKDNKQKKNIVSWYQDRYLMAIVQRNFLLIFSVVSSIGVLICLILIKNFYEGKTVEPYLVEVDKKTGIASVVDTKSKEQYTSNEIVRESYIMQYVRAREQYSQEKVDDYQNILRVLSSPSIYKIYTTEQANIPAEQKFSLNDKALFSTLSLSKVQFDRCLLLR
jgi:type IV secretion system protein VirB8